MTPKQIKQIALLRLVIGYLGEQNHWWNSTFCSPVSKSFLSPVFPKTLVLAQLQGVSMAALRVHDQHIGVGNAFHLFRLPEEIEQNIPNAVKTEEQNTFLAPIVSPQAALNYLQENSNTSSRKLIGPVRIGAIASLPATSIWHEVASLYARAFDDNEQVFPFFSDIS